MNPTPSPERPEQPEVYFYIPEKYRLVTDDEKKQPLPCDALVWVADKGVWAYSPNAGKVTPNIDFIYATRTPAPEAVAGELGELGDKTCDCKCCERIALIQETTSTALAALTTPSEEKP